MGQPRLTGGLATSVRKVKEPSERRGPRVLVDPAERLVEVIAGHLPVVQRTIGGNQCRDRAAAQSVLDHGQPGHPRHGVLRLHRNRSADAEPGPGAWRPGCAADQAYAPEVRPVGGQSQQQEGTVVSGDGLVLVRTQHRPRREDCRCSGLSGVVAAYQPRERLVSSPRATRVAICAGQSPAPWSSATLMTW